MGTSPLWGHQLCPADPFRFIPPRELSRPFPGSPTAGGDFLSHKPREAEALFSPFLLVLEQTQTAKAPTLSPLGRAGASNSSTGLAGARAAGPARGEREEDGGGRNRHVHVFSWRERLFQQDLPREQGYHRAPLQHRDQLQDRVGPGRMGRCPREEMWDVRSGLEGISADPEGSVFHCGGREKSIGH